MLTRCPACDAPAPEPFFALRGLPVHSSAFFADAASARAVAVGDQSLALCPQCGVVFNRDVDERLLDATGEHGGSPFHSPRFAAYAAEITARWVDRYGLIDQHLVEVGCGTGDFAAELLGTGAASVTGVDPRFTPDRVPRELAGRLTAVPEPFTAEHVDPATAALVCRHTLEHVTGLAGFGAEIVAGLRRTDGAMFLAEVPDLSRILAEGAFWDLQFEHFSYFTPATLGGFLIGLGFDAPLLHTTYSDQYVVAEARLGARTAAPHHLPEVELEQLTTACHTFADRVTSQIDRWREWFGQRADRGDNVVVWGSGPKGLTFLNVMAGGDEKPAVQAVVDTNPSMQGDFTAGLGLPICGPDDLAAEPPRCVLVMNPVYLGEVRSILDARGMTTTDVLAV